MRSKRPPAMWRVWAVARRASPPARILVRPCPRLMCSRTRRCVTAGALGQECREAAQASQTAVCRPVAAPALVPPPPPAALVCIPAAVHTLVSLLLLLSRSNQDDAGGDETKFDAFLGNDAGVLGATGVYDEEDREVRLLFFHLSFLVEHFPSQTEQL